MTLFFTRDCGGMNACKLRGERLCFGCEILVEENDWSFEFGSLNSN